VAVSRRIPHSSPWLITTCTTAAAANGQIMSGKSLGLGRCGTPLKYSNAFPAANPDTAYIAPLKSRSATISWRRRLITAIAPVSAAPMGPSRTTAASVADELGDQADCRVASGVGVASQTRNSSWSTPSSIHQCQECAIACRGKMTVTAAAAITAIYSHAPRDTLAMRPPSPSVRAAAQPRGPRRGAHPASPVRCTIAT
jgi:hypothetical protein